MKTSLRSSLTNTGCSFFITALSSLGSFHTLFNRHADSMAGSWWVEKGFTATFYVFCKLILQIFYFLGLLYRGVTLRVPGCSFLI